VKTTPGRCAAAAERSSQNEDNFAV
jgi:hypothetical protein